MGVRREVQNEHLPPSGVARGLGQGGQNVAEGGSLATAGGHYSTHRRRKVKK